jgi:hypothetical protein
MISRRICVRQKAELAPRSEINVRHFQRLHELQLLQRIQSPHILHQAQPQPFEEAGEGVRLIQSAERKL